MISSDNEMVITDWETSRRGLVVHDLAKLIRTNPTIERKYIEWLSDKLDMKNICMKNELSVDVVLSGIDLNGNGQADESEQGRAA